MTISYTVSHFFILPEEEQSPLPVKSFNKYSDAMNYFKKQFEIMTSKMKNSSPDTWFIEVIEYDTEDEEIKNTRVVRHEGNI